MATTALEDYAAIVSVRNPQKIIDTTTFFDINSNESEQSPYDQFLHNSIQLNKNWALLRADQEIDPEMGILLLLGYVSAIEGYMRALIRRLVNCDPFSQKACESFQVTYGAVMHHHRNSLSDALLEETVFSTGPSIGNALQKFIGSNPLSGNTKSLINQYDAICQLRHCCVHRFGKLGAKNAIALGLLEHSPFLEKRVVIRKAEMADIADLIFGLVKSINNEVFGYVLKRSATSKLTEGASIGLGWTWSVRKDTSRFAKYYSIFASRNDAPPSPPQREIYERFRSAHRNVGGQR